MCPLQHLGQALLVAAAPLAVVPCPRRIADGCACDADPAVQDQGLQPRAREFCDALRQHAVETDAGFLGGDGDPVVRGLGRVAVYPVFSTVAIRSSGVTPAGKLTFAFSVA